MSRILCRLDEIPDGEARGFKQDGAEDIFVVRQGDRVYGYANSCPHAASPLDWVESQFMSLDKSHILCATHGAEFRIEDGYCVLGPCRGQSLTAVNIVLSGDDVLLD